MNELVKTIVFVAAAGVIALVAVSSHFMNRPTNAADFELVGKPFFEEFTSAKQAQNMEVVAVDPETARRQRFSVQLKDGLWRIPSHYDYPAEAADRLATTATSVMGIHRDSLAGRLAKEHERLGVVDPLSDDIEDPESVGKRITMKDADGEVVMDYIIGKEVDQEVVLSRTERPFGTEGNEKYYFIRRPDEQQTYKVKLEIDLSTKFSDWIDPDLLRLEPTDLTRIAIDNYSIEEDRSAAPANGMTALYKAQGDKIEVTRKSSTEPWELEGLEPKTEELDSTKINELIGVLDQMKIVGVRPKFKYKNHLLLTADLQLNRQPEFEANPQEFGQAIVQLQNELDQKGFNLAGNAEKMELVSQQGELQLGTDQGIVYTLHIGKDVEGDEQAIEIGTPSADNEKTADKESKKDDTKEPNANAEGTKTDDAGDPKTPEDDPLADAKNRYLMIRVSFDEGLINPKPVKPVEPVEPVVPEGYEPPAEDKPKTPDEEAPEDVQKPGESADENKSKQDEKPVRNPEFVKYDEAKIQFEQQKIEFELAQTRFADETKQLEEKIAEVMKLVGELNERFADWYYVISADNLKTLQSQRKDLVTSKQPPPAQPQVMPPRPDISFPGLPGAPGNINPVPPTEGQSNPVPEGSASKPDDANPVPPQTRQPETQNAPETATGQDPEKPADGKKDQESENSPQGEKTAGGDNEKDVSEATKAKPESEAQKQQDAGSEPDKSSENAGSSQEDQPDKAGENPATEKAKSADGSQ